MAASAKLIPLIPASVPDSHQKQKRQAAPAVFPTLEEAGLSLRRGLLLLSGLVTQYGAAMRSAGVEHRQGK